MSERLGLAAAPPSRTAEWSRTWDLLFAFTTRELILRYRGTVFGYVWWLARPLALGLLLWFAMSKVLDVNIPDYHLFIMTGLFPWFWFSSAVSESTNVLVNNGPLLKKVPFPRVILPLSCAFGNAAQFVLTLPVLLAFVMIGGKSAEPVWLIGIPFLILLQFTLTVGIGMALSPLNVFLRDMAPLVEVTTTMLFYASAVIFPLDRVPESMRPIVHLNPIASLMEGWRSVILEGAFPGIDIWPALVSAALAAVVGLTIFRALENHVADGI